MFFTYLTRELTKRRKQTLIISLGMALAITLVVLMSGISTGIAATQQKALAAIYGVGTDLTVTKTATATTNNGTQQFNFGANAGTQSGTKRNLSSANLTVARGSTAYSQSVLTTVQKTANVTDATGVLLLESTTFSGQVPSGTSASSGTTQPNTRPTSGTTSTTSGPSAFNLNSISVAGVTTDTKVGPLSSVSLSSGRLLKASDAGTYTVVLDSNYAKSASKKVGSTVKIDGKSFKVVGIVKNTSTSTTSSTNAYIPLTTAQKLSGETNKITTVYVKANSSSSIDAISSSLSTSLKSYTVNTQSELASTVTSSAGSATSIVQTFGFWIVIIALAAAFLLAILFTVSGVSRRTRELGTLKSLGWSNGRIVRQITGESIIQALLGGVIGSALGIIAIQILNAIHPTISAATSSTFNGPGGTGGPGAASQAATQATTLTAVLTPEVIAYAFAIALIGGIVAGIVGAARAAHLRPAEALRSI